MDETWYDCRSCHAEPVRLELLGHDAPPTGMWDENLVTGERLARCPMRELLDADPVTRQEAYELAYVQFPLFKHGHLFRAGAISEQPAWWIEAMTLLDTMEHQKKAAYLRAERASEE